MEKIEKEQTFLSIVIQVKNHQKFVKEFFIDIDNLLKNRFKSYEYVIVNNNSKDDTMKTIENISEKIKGSINVVNLPWDHNIENSMKAGIDLAIGDFVFEFDRPIKDFENELMINMYLKCLEGYDIVAAVPDSKIKFSSKLFYRILNKVSYRNMELITENFRIVSRRAINRTMSKKGSFKYRKALYHYSGFDTKIIRYKKTKDYSVDDLNIIDKIEFVSNVLVYYSNLGTKVCGLISLIFLLLSISGFFYAVFSYIFHDNLVSGWTTIMLFLSGSFTGLFIVLMFISKYLESILTEIKNNTSYTYKSVDKFQKK